MTAPLPSAPARDPSPGDVRRVFTAVMLPMFLGSIDQTLMAAASPAIASDLGSLRDTTWVALAYLMAATATIPLYGRLGDRHGRRRCLLFALTLFGAGCLLGAFAPSLGWLVAARGLQGLGGGGLMVLSQALIGELVDPRRRASYQGWFTGVYMAASIGGLVAGGFVVHHVGWRWLFGGLLPFVAVALMVVRSLPTRAEDRHAPTVDVLGFAAFAATGALWLVWITFAGHRFAWGSAGSAALASSAAAALVLFCVQQRRSASPLLPVELLALPPMRALAATVALNAAVLFSLVYFLPIMVQLGQGTDARAAALSVVPLMGGAVIASAAAGRWMSRSGRVGTLPRWGLAWAALMLGILAWTLPCGWALGVLTFSSGLGLGTVMSTSQIAAQAVAGPARPGAAAALASLSRSVGATVGAAAFSATVYGEVTRLQSHAPHATQAATLLEALQHGFVLLAFCTLLGAWVARRMPAFLLVPRDAAHGPPEIKPSKAA